MENNKRELGLIEHVHLGTQDHGVMTVWLTFDFGGTGQGFGGYCLDTVGKETSKTFKREPTVGGMAFIMGIMEAVGVDSWDKIKGKEMWVEREEPRGNIVAIEAPSYRKGGGRFDVRDWQRKWFPKPKEAVNP